MGLGPASFPGDFENDGPPKTGLGSRPLIRMDAVRANEWGGADGRCARAPTVPFLATRGQHQAARVSLASCLWARRG